MVRRTLLMAALATPLFAFDAGAQTWDAPLFFSPKPMDDIALYYFRSDVPSLGGGMNGVKVGWRQSGNLNLGLQAGVGDLDDMGNTILVGAEFYQPLSGLSASTGLITSWHLGAGASFGEGYVDLRVPLGVSVGINVGSGVVPYVHPRVSLDLAAVDVNGVEETTTDVGFAVDLGADLNLGDRLVLRAAYTIGSRNDVGKRDAFGVGIALRTPRKLVVR